MKHTPGPWSYENARTYDDLDRECYRIYGLGDINISKVSGDITEEKANARLIAAAPDLLEALIYIENIINHKDGLRNRKDLITDDERAWVTRAIAKAEGRD